MFSLIFLICKIFLQGPQTPLSVNLTLPAMKVKWLITFTVVIINIFPGAENYGVIKKFDIFIIALFNACDYIDWPDYKRTCLHYREVWFHSCAQWIVIHERRSQTWILSPYILKKTNSSLSANVFCMGCYTQYVYVCLYVWVYVYIFDSTCFALFE